MAAATRRVRVGCLVLVHGTRLVESLAAQLATVDALSGGRLEIGLGIGDAFAKRDFDALGLRFPAWTERVASWCDAVDRLLALTTPGSPLSAPSVQAPLPLILGGASEPVRRLAIERGLAWNLATGSAESFGRLSVGQPDPQAQLFLSRMNSVPETVARFREAGATRLVFVMEPPIAPGAVTRLARDAGL